MRNAVIDLPIQVKQIIETLENAGYESYVVGGCVRDSILGRVPDDWDMTTSATPEQVKALFKKTIDTGIQHGTVTVMIQGEGYEVTTYRIDGEYEDSRHPKEVIFTPSLEEDLKRRDFTINAMAYNENGIVDLFGGMEDIEKSVIRCVGNPVLRFQEDALRMMRCVRFSAQLGYEIEERTWQAAKQLVENLSYISAERIQVELVKLVTSPHPEYLRKAYEMGITKVVFPEFDRMMEQNQNHIHHCYSVGEHTLHGMMAIRNDKVLRLAMLFHDIGKPTTSFSDEEGVDHFYGHPKVGEELTKQVLKRLRFDNDTVYRVTKLVYYHDRDIELSLKSMRSAIKQIGVDLMDYLIEIKQADVLAQSEYKREDKLKYVDKLRLLHHEVMENEDPVSLKQLAVTGKDLLEAGVEPGKKVGEMLSYLLDIVIENPENNCRQILLDEVHNKI